MTYKITEKYTENSIVVEAESERKAVKKVMKLLFKDRQYLQEKEIEIQKINLVVSIKKTIFEF